MNEIDLSKIKVKETAKSTIKANFDGAEKDFEIRALNEGEKVTFTSILTNSKDVYRTRNMYVHLLSCGLDWEQGICDLIFDNNPKEAIRVAEEIYKLSKIFDDAKVKEAKTAEKNSRKEEVK
jgi:hypothetical protein